MAKYQYPQDFEGTFWTIIDGDYYVSTFGSDEGGLGSPQEPYATINKAMEVAKKGDKIISGPIEEEFEVGPGGTVSPGQFGSEPPVKAVSDTPIDIASYGLSPVDSVSIVDGERVLLTAQSNAAENGIYEASIGTWQRAADYNQASIIYKGKLIPVVAGEKYGNTIFQNNTVPNIVLGTTPLSFVQITTEAEAVGAGAESLSYIQLKQLALNNELVAGSFYELTDYRTKYQMNNTTEIKEGNIEPLILQAASNSAFKLNVVSTLFPKDIIQYDFEDDLCEDGSTARTGKITYREDPFKKLSTYYDWRTVQFRRWQITGIYHHSATTSDNSTYSCTITYGAVDASPSRYREYYIEFSTLTNNPDPILDLTKGSNQVSRPLLKPGGIAISANELQSLLPSGKGLVYYSPTYDAYILVNNANENNQVVGYHSWRDDGVFSIGNGTRLTVDNADSQDYFTFGNTSDGGALYDIQIGKWGNFYNNIIFQKNDYRNKHVHIKDKSYNMTFNNVVVWSITIGEDCHDNLILSDMSWSRIDNEFFNNLVSRPLLRYLYTLGVHYNVSYLGTGSYYYLLFKSYVINTTIRILEGGGGNGQSTFTGIISSSFLNLNNFNASLIDGRFVNKSTEISLNWGNLKLSINDSSPAHYDTDFPSKIVKNVPITSLVQDLNALLEKSLVPKKYVNRTCNNNVVVENSSFVLTSDYDGKIIECNGTFTIALDENINSEFHCEIVNIGTGDVTFEESGVAILISANNVLKNQWDYAKVYNNTNNTNQYMIIGDVISMP